MGIDFRVQQKLVKPAERDTVQLNADGWIGKRIALETNLREKSDILSVSNQPGRSIVAKMGHPKVREAKRRRRSFVMFDNFHCSRAYFIIFRERRDITQFVFPTGFTRFRINSIELSPLAVDSYFKCMGKVHRGSVALAPPLPFQLMSGSQNYDAQLMLCEHKFGSHWSRIRLNFAHAPMQQTEDMACVQTIGSNFGTKWMHKLSRPLYERHTHTAWECYRAALCLRLCLCILSINEFMSFSEHMLSTQCLNLIYAHCAPCSGGIDAIYKYHIMSECSLC